MALGLDLIKLAKKELAMHRKKCLQSCKELGESNVGSLVKHLRLKQLDCLWRRRCPSRSNADSREFKRSEFAKRPLKTTRPKLEPRAAL